MSQSAYLIQGFYSQRRDYMDVAVVPGEGNVAVFSTGLFRCMFAGVITQDELFGALTGRMTDGSGASVLTEISVSDEELLFKKTYNTRPDPIHYVFRLKGGIWCGSFQGSAVGTGRASCVLTPVPQQIFEP